MVVRAKDDHTAPGCEAASGPVGDKRGALQKKRKQLSYETDMLVFMIKKMKKTEEQEYKLSKEVGVSSIQDKYHEVPMPSLGTMSIPNGQPLACNYASIPGKVARTFAYHFENDDDESESESESS